MRNSVRMRKRQRYKPSRKYDAQYKHISQGVAEKARKEREGFEQEMYVDSYRGISVQLGGLEVDLKEAIDLSGLAIFNANAELVGAPNDLMYLKQGEHLMKKGVFSPALTYLNQALLLNPESKSAQAMKAKCHLLMGNWSNALDSAEQVLKIDKKFVKAIFVKAESLYNTCSFEHALMYYYRGQRLTPDTEEFRLGIQKCRKTIQDGIKNDDVFKGTSAEIIFKFFQKTADLRLGDAYYNIIPTKQSVETIQLPNRLEDMVKQLEKIDAKARRPRTAPPSTMPEIPENSNSNSNETKPTLKLISLKKIVPAILCKRGAGPDSEAKMKVVQRRCAQKAKLVLSGDRLLEDKLYLTALSGRIKEREGLKTDIVKRNISQTANQALDYLKSREEFWNQLQLGTSGKSYEAKLKVSQKLKI